MNKKDITILIDMDGVLCNYEKAISYFREKISEQHFPQAQLKFFENLEPMPNAIKAYNILKDKYNVKICSRPSTKNPLCYMEKRLWVEKHLGYEECENLILIEDKTQVVGDWLIDDNIQTGDYDPTWKQIHFGSEEYPDWNSILNYFL